MYNMIRLKVFYRICLVSLFLFLSTSGSKCPERCTCSSGLYDCRNQKFTNVKASIGADIIPDDVRTIDLSINEIHKVETIPEAPGLLYLNLATNGINNLTYDAFDNLDELTTLILSDNSLSRITDDIFEWNPLKLETLKLDNNQIEFIQHFLFYDLESLTELDLHNNKISFIHPHAFLQLKKLVTIRLDGNLLHTFDSKWFKGLQANMFNKIHLDNNPWSCDCAMAGQIKWLKDTSWFTDVLSSDSLICSQPSDMNTTSIAKIDKNTKKTLVCNSPNIVGISENTKLYSGQNIELDCKVEGRPNATIAWIAPNEDRYTLQNADRFDGIEVYQNGTLIIRGFGKSDDAGTYTCVATNIKGSVQATTVITVHDDPPPPDSEEPELDPGIRDVEDEVAHVSITDCPDGCSCASFRVDCTSQDHGLKDVPKNIPSNAYTLSLASNNITTIPKFEEIPALTELRLDNNKISKIVAHAFDNLGNLSTLTMRDNRIQKLNGKLFKKLKKLSVLVLDNNLLSSIGDETFTGLVKLKWLYMRNNKLAELGDWSFSPLMEVKFIHLEGNELPALTEDTIKALTETENPTIQRIFVNDNKFYCDCRLRNLKSYLSDDDPKNDRKTLFGDGISCSYPPELNGKYLQAVDELKCNNSIVTTFYTYGGNANGAPCAFPFQYKEKSYHGCIQVGSDRSKPWCATSLDYPRDGKWGYCDTSVYTKIEEEAPEYTPPSSGTMGGLWFAGLVLGLIACVIGFFVWKKRGRRAWSFKSLKYRNLPGNDEIEEYQALNDGTSGSEAYV